MLAWLALFLSWGSLGLETATVVVSSPGGSGLDGILSDSRLSGWQLLAEAEGWALWEPGPHRGTPKLPGGGFSVRVSVRPLC